MKKKVQTVMVISSTNINKTNSLVPVTPDMLLLLDGSGKGSIDDRNPFSAKKNMHSID